MDVKAPLLTAETMVVVEDNSPAQQGWVSRVFSCGRRQGAHVPTNAETVQRLMDMKVKLAMRRDRVMQDYEKKAAEVAQLAKRGLKAQAYESMRTAKQWKREWETLHSMYESVERIKSRLIAQQNNMALFSSFAAANESLAKMLEQVPLEKVEEVLDQIQERMSETQEVGDALASPATNAANSVDDDELALFLAQGDQVYVVPPPLTVGVAATSPLKTSGTGSRLAME
jgi:molybdopterin converting factor small subunit